jgi:serine/threonine protein kinase
MTHFGTRQMTNALQGSSDEGNLKNGSVLQDRYLILGVLGVGGMGAVYQARDLRFPSVTKLVAVKEMINLVADPSMRAMILRNFEREGNLLAALNHPAIPKIYDVFSNPEHSYLIMEYIEGKDLEAVLSLAEGFLPVTQVVEWAIQLCDVLTYLHGQPEPIVFRDMKPSNVMLDQHDNVRLIDFGIAKGFQAGQKGTMIGTEGYSPPEQYRGEAGPLGDLYALGATLHHLLTKRDPRLEPPFSFAERPLRKINPEVPEALEQIINKSLAYNPGERFPSAATMKQALWAYRKATMMLPPTEATQPPTAASAIPSPGATTILPNLPQSGATAIVDQPLASAIAQSGIVPLWVFRCEDEIRSQPLPVGKFVYVSVYDNNLYALSRSDGKFVWKYASEGGFAASPVFDSGTVYIGSEDNNLYALNGESGRMLWNYETKEPVRCTARVAQGHIFVGSDDGSLHAVNAQAGRGVWKFDAGAPIRSRPAVLEKEARVFFGCESGEFYCVDFTGQRKWVHRSKRAVTSSAIIADGLVIFGSADSSVYAVEAASGWAAWKARTHKAIVSSPAANERAIFIGSADNNLYAFDLRAGKKLWEFETGDQVASSPAVYKSAVYFGSVDGWVYCVEAKDGKLRWKFKTEGPVISSPTVLDDVVYIGSADRNLYALAA